jgi:peroxiredoxin (alkyl hydroperoxide reductase subunit C)
MRRHSVNLGNTVTFHPWPAQCFDDGTFIKQQHLTNTQAVRAVFVIDPKAQIRAVLYYPLSNSRNFSELKRLIALQTADKHGCATPADWQPGDDVIVPPPGSCGTAKQRVEKLDPDTYALDWFMTFKKLPKVK